MILDRPSVSVEGPMQQGVESIVEMTTASSVTSDGSGDPFLWLLLLRKLHAVARTATVIVVSVSIKVSSSSQDALWWCRGASLAKVQGRAASQTPPPAKARGKSPAAPGPGVGAPVPRAGSDIVSPGGWTVLSPCGAVDAQQGEMAKKGSPTYVHCI
jgi:hypothetical protein